MPSTLEACEKYFGSKNLYEIFGIEKNALEKDGELKKVFFYFRKLFCFRLTCG